MLTQRINKAPSNLQVILQPDKFIDNLSKETINKVELIWAMEKNKRGKDIFNGKILSVINISNNLISTIYTQYKYFLAQFIYPELFNILQIKPLAVSGILHCTDGVVWGKRSQTLTQDPGKWELVPSGGIDINKIEEPISQNYNIDFLAQIYTELKEEIGVQPDLVSNANPMWIIEDKNSHVTDIVINIEISANYNSILELYNKNTIKEYEELRIFSKEDINKLSQNNDINFSEISIQIANNVL